MKNERDLKINRDWPPDKQESRAGPTPAWALSHRAIAPAPTSQRVQKDDASAAAAGALPAPVETVPGNP